MAETPRRRPFRIGKLLSTMRHRRHSSLPPTLNAADAIAVSEPVVKSGDATRAAARTADDAGDANANVNAEALSHQELLTQSSSSSSSHSSVDSSPFPSSSASPSPFNVNPNDPQVQQQHLSLIARHRRRRKIRAKLDEVAGVVSEPRVDHEDAHAFFSATSCAILTDGGEIIVTKSTGSTRPFEMIAHKIRLLRTSTFGITQYLSDSKQYNNVNNNHVIHLRGHAGIIIHAYLLGKHTLIAITEVSPGARNLDTVVDRIDRCLGISVSNNSGDTIIEQLYHMLLQF